MKSDPKQTPIQTADASCDPPRVTVIIPTYRRDAFLRLAMESALAQTFGDFELIVSDSARSQSTRDLVCGIDDRRVRYRTNAQITDHRANHLAAWREARGRYVAYLHDDDLWEPSYLERLVGVLEANPQCVAAFPEQLIIDEFGQPCWEKTHHNTRLWKRDTLREGVHQPSWDLLVNQSVPSVMGAMFDRDAISPDDVPLEAEMAFDLWMTYLLCRTGGGIYYISERLMRYRVHPGSETACPTSTAQGSVFCWQQFMAAPELRPYRKTLVQRAWDASLTSASLNLKRDRQALARKLALRAQRYRITAHGLAILLMALAPGHAATRLLQWRDRCRGRVLKPQWSDLASGADGTPIPAVSLS